MRIGFVGLGTMGGPMARRLAAQGHQVAGYDVDAARAARAREGGVTLATSPGGAAENADAVLSSLPDPAALRRAYLGADGVLSTVKAGATLLDLSTVDPDTWREVAAAARVKGVDCLDAPVSGGPAEAGSGKLVFLVGGDGAVVERCRTLLLTLGTEIHHVGPLGSGQIIKLVNNVMSIGNVAVAAEAMVLGVKAGLDPQAIYDVVRVSTGNSFAFETRVPRILKRDFSPGGTVDISFKDQELETAFAKQLGVPVLLANVTQQVYQMARAAGLNKEDGSAVVKVYEQLAGVKVGGKG